MPDKVFKALGDPTRRQILRILSRQDLSAGDIAEQFSVTAPTMSHHLKVLKDADLVAVERSGNQLVYSLNATVFQEVIAAVMDMFGRQSEESDK